MDKGRDVKPNDRPASESWKKPGPPRKAAASTGIAAALVAGVHGSGHAGRRHRVHVAGLRPAPGHPAGEVEDNEADRQQAAAHEDAGHDDFVVAAGEAGTDAAAADRQAGDGEQQCHHIKDGSTHAPLPASTQPAQAQRQPASIRTHALIDADQWT